LPKYGDIVIVADVLDPNGRNPKNRACVVVTPSDEIEVGGPLDVVAITSLVPNPLPVDHVPLPWHAQRRARTGLDKPNVAVCTWNFEVEDSRIIRAIGRVPDKEMLRIASILSMLSDQDESEE
jgi:mRNA-degrading endonuclease toxin of MazEF toxin-antitoxin module